jgi:hypothetical protein
MKRKRKMNRPKTRTVYRSAAKPIKRRRRRSLSAKANIGSLATMFGTALLGGIAGGVVVRRIPNLVSNPMLNTAIKAGIGIGGTYLITNTMKSTIGAAGFAAGYGSELIKELNIPGLSEELMAAEFVDPTTLSETLVLDDNGDLIPMSELMEDEFAEYELMAEDDEMSELMEEDLDEEDLDEQDELSARKRSRLRRLVEKSPQAQALRYIYPRAFRS